MNIPIVKPVLGEEEVESVAAVVRSGWLAQGKKVAEFEKLVAETVEAREVVVLSSCTTALHIALRIAGLQCGDWACISKPCLERCEVICPSYTFVATINALLYMGIRPVLVDIDPNTGNIDPARLEQAITPCTRAIMPVHQLGYPADMDAIEAIALRHNLFVIEDAACALGARYKGRPIGSNSASVCFSFHPRKAVTTAEGGAIATNDPALAERARVLRSHGASVSAELREQSKAIVYEQYVDVGYNYRMSDVHAAIGVEQMKRLPGILQRRGELAQIYTEAFTGSEWILPPLVPSGYTHAYQTYAVRLNPACPLSRDTVMQKMAEHGIGCRRGIPPVHLEPFFLERFGRLHLPNTEQVSRQSLFLPLYPQMRPDEQAYVIDHLTQCVRP